MQSIVEPKILKYNDSKWYFDSGKKIIPESGEIYVITLEDIDKTIIKIGDGIHALQNLPEVHPPYHKIKPQGLSDYWLQVYIDKIPQDIWDEAVKEVEECNSQSYGAMVAVAIEKLVEVYESQFEEDFI